MEPTPMDISITGDDLATLLVIFFIGVIAVVLVQWLLRKM